jgi:predicted NBD/HSP70 family sugar kinase
LTVHPGIHDARAVAELVKRGESDAVARLRAAGRILGKAVAYATSLLNPNVIVLGGILSATGDHMLAGVREVIYQRSLPLATRQLRIVPMRYRSRAGIAGAGYLVRDHVLSPATLDLTHAKGASSRPEESGQAATPAGVLGRRPTGA